MNGRRRGGEGQGSNRNIHGMGAESQAHTPGENTLKHTHTHTNKQTRPHTHTHTHAHTRTHTHTHTHAHTHTHTHTIITLHSNIVYLTNYIYQTEVIVRASGQDSTPYTHCSCMLHSRHTAVCALTWKTAS